MNAGIRLVVAPLLVLLSFVAGCIPMRGIDGMDCPACDRPKGQDLPRCGHDPDDYKQKFFETMDDNTADVLILSAGGSWGAWGAGMLAGWDENTGADKRPATFEVIVGSSTGALQGVFAMLFDDPVLGAAGRDMEAEMTQAYTTYPTKEILTRRPLWKIPYSTSINTLEPLRDKMRNKHFTLDVMQRLRDLYDDEGRMLWVGTTNMDTGQFCNWNLSALDPSTDYDLFIDLLHATSANPVVFDPVMIDDELHADGGVSHQFFATVLETAVDAYDALPAVPITPPRAWAVINGQLAVRPKCVVENIVPIALRATEIVTHYALSGDLAATDLVFNPPTSGPARPWVIQHSIIPEDYELWPSADVFDVAAMKDLYDRAHHAADNPPHPDGWQPGLPQRRTTGPATDCLPPLP